jgi:hypothetical protein
MKPLCAALLGVILLSSARLRRRDIQCRVPHHQLDGQWWDVQRAGLPQRCRAYAASDIDGGNEHESDGSFTNRLASASVIGAGVIMMKERTG